MKVATIGSGMIVDRMMEAISKTEGIEVVAVYSRTQERADEFAKKHGISKTYTDLDVMLQDPQIDTVYVASPNSLHYEQTKKALLAGKHVINEKPFVPTVAMCKELFDIAKEKHVFLFEAITTIHVPNYKIVKEHLADVGEIKFVQCNFSQYSSRYQKYKDHEQTNAFDPNFAGGALMDINVYCLHFVTGLFGLPESMTYTANIGYNDIDTSGIAILKYPGFIATCIGAKDSSSDNHVYIQGDKGTLVVSGSSCGVCKNVSFIPPKKDMIGKVDVDTSQNIGIDQEMHMIYECEKFVSIVEQRDFESYEILRQHTLDVVSLLEEGLRQRDA